MLIYASRHSLHGIQVWTWLVVAMLNMDLLLLMSKVVVYIVVIIIEYLIL